MINRGFKLTVDDIKKFSEFKQTQAYRSYIEGVGYSQLYTGIIKEHLENIDISEDVKRLRGEGRISNSISESTIKDLFLSTLAKLSLRITADTIILKELEDVHIDNVINDIQTETDIIYMLGLAEEQYYDEAKKLVEEGKIDKNDLIFRGLMAHLSIKEKIPKSKKVIKEEPKKTKIVQETKKNQMNFDSNDIEL